MKTKLFDELVESVKEGGRIMRGNKWIMEVAIQTRYGEITWLAVRPTGRLRYEYDTYREARTMLDSCYPNEFYGVTVRVRQLKDGE